MRKSTALLLVVVALAAVYAGYAWHIDGRGALDEGATAGPLTLSGTPLERGRYLAAAADCVACHTAPGGAEYAGGVAFRLPFGTIYSSNLTPDPVAGIGGWSDEDFLKAVRSGVGRGGRHLYPAHPYTSYAGMARDDVLAIKAFLGSLPAVADKVPESDLRFPFSQRGLMPLWNAAYFKGGRFRPDAGHDAAWNRGAYLATALGHCGECHTPRNFAFALREGHALEGAVTRGWKAYGITASADAGIGGWTEAELNQYLAVGHASGRGAAAGPMREVVAFSTSQLTPDDRAALVGYLLAGRSPAGAAGAASATPVSVTPPGPGVGVTLYAGACAGCHGADPAGSATAAVDLRGARSVRDPDGTNLLKLLSEGSPHGSSVAVAMPDFGSYSDTERAALANFVLAEWGGITPSKTPNDARRAREAD